MIRLLRIWWPAVVWAGIIFALSTNSFSSKDTFWIFTQILKWLDPSISARELHLLNHMLRKSAHITEYGIFYLLLFRSFRSDRKGWGWSWALAALAVAAGYSAFDEIHQIFVPSRGPSAWDSLLDTSAALLTSVLLWLWYRIRRPKLQAADSPGELK